MEAGHPLFGNRSAQRPQRPHIGTANETLNRKKKGNAIRENKNFGIFFIAIARES